MRHSSPTSRTVPASAWMTTLRTGSATRGAAPNPPLRLRHGSSRSWKKSVMEGMATTRLISPRPHSVGVLGVTTCRFRSLCCATVFRIVWINTVNCSTDVSLQHRSLPVKSAVYWCALFFVDPFRQTLAAARKLRTPNNVTKIMDLNPKSIKTEELYGFISMATREWKDGLLSKVCYRSHYHTEVHQRPCEYGIAWQDAVVSGTELPVQADPALHVRRSCEIWEIFQTKSPSGFYLTAIWMPTGLRA